MPDFGTDGKKEKRRGKRKQMQKQQQQGWEGSVGKVERAAAMCLCPACEGNVQCLFLREGNIQCLFLRHLHREKQQKEWAHGYRQMPVLTKQCMTMRNRKEAMKLSKQAFQQKGT